MNKSIEILDTTLRDGAYMIDFQFTANDTAVICAALEDAGFRTIEVAHGLGLGASGTRWGVAAATDEEYLRAAATSLRKARFGTFFIPGIGTKEHLDLARGYGMSFVRIGTNITQSEEAEEFIKYAKLLGFEVMYNAMKSYVAPPEEFLRRMRQAVEWGADVVYLVDSAGGMLPAEVKQYIELLRENLDARVGFHGHNNFMLGCANNLAALEAGATLLDSTIQGMGRSSGNPQTEVMILLYEKLGISTGIDIFKTMEIGESLIRPLMPVKSGVTALDMTMAHAQFHSSFLPRVERAASEFKLDPKVLIVEVSKVDRINPSQELITSIAAKLAGAHSQSAVTCT
ncbi:MAG: 4-hydroxy 2-oxovalerate aldolase [Blastocatellia bacterium]|jgi:4-hydroxy-2-oxovalerate aldolase|nr:4-hydroxy 2-oxovalerate aldolase [Blastocatellia bacterium]